NGFFPPMIRLPTFSPAAPTKTPPPSFVPPAVKHSPHGPRSPAWRWLRNHACRRPSLNPVRLSLFHRRQVDGAQRSEAHHAAGPEPGGHRWWRRACNRPACAENLSQRVSAQCLIPTPFVVYFLGLKQPDFTDTACLTEIICFPSSQ